MIALLVSDHRHHVIDSRIVADSNAERCGLTCARSGDIDASIPLPILVCEPNEYLQRPFERKFYLRGFAERYVQRCPAAKLDEYPHSSPKAIIARQKATRLLSVAIRRWKEYALQFGSAQDKHNRSWKNENVKRASVYPPKDRTSRLHHARQDQNPIRAIRHHFRYHILRSRQGVA